MANDKDLVWEEVSTEHIIRDKWIDLRRSAFRFPDGRIFEPYYSYTRRDYAIVVPTDDEGNILCVRQFRQGIRKVTTEFPAGGIESRDRPDAARPAPGQCSPEQALAAARRELREETGYESDRWSFLMKVPSNATISDNYAYLFTAENCRRRADQELDEMELLRVEKYTPEQIDALIAQEKFQQADHILAWLLSRKQKEKTGIACRKTGETEP